jgi:mevalonate kinase
MSNKTEIFYGKVLLFGEYSILFNSKGLTIPYTHFTGQLSFINDDKYTDFEFAVQSNKQLLEFYDFMLQLEADRKIIEAKGARDAQIIMSEGLTDQILKLKSIEALNNLAKSPNGKIIISNGTTPFLLDQ